MKIVNKNVGFDEVFCKALSMWANIVELSPLRYYEKDPSFTYRVTLDTVDEQRIAVFETRSAAGTELDRIKSKETEEFLDILDDGIYIVDLKTLEVLVANGKNMSRFFKVPLELPRSSVLCIGNDGRFYRIYNEGGYATCSYLQYAINRYYFPEDAPTATGTHILASLICRERGFEIPLPNNLASLKTAILPKKVDSILDNMTVTKFTSEYYAYMESLKNVIPVKQEEPREKFINLSQVMEYGITKTKEKIEVKDDISLGDEFYIRHMYIYSDILVIECSSTKEDIEFFWGMVTDNKIERKKVRFIQITK